MPAPREPTPADAAAPPPATETGVTDELIEAEVQSHLLARAFRPVRWLYEWVLGWAETRYAGLAMAALAWAEAVFFPVPADLLLVALCLGRPRRSFRWGAICTAFSILGGTSAMLLGLAVGQARVVAAMDAVGLGPKTALALETFHTYGFWAVAVAALTPVPYMVFSWVAGFAELAPWQFVAASVIFRSMRFFGVAMLVYLFGQRAKRFIDRYFNLCTVAVMVLVILVVVLAKAL